MSLFGRQVLSGQAPFAAAQHQELGEGAWIESAPGWLSGHETLFDLLVETACWESHQLQMYDRIVDVPRLVAGAPDESHHRSRAGLDEVRRRLGRMAGELSHRYGRDLSNITLGYYRDGRDSVALHGDKLGALRSDTVVAIVSLGEPRKFLLRKKGQPFPLSQVSPNLNPCKLDFFLGAGDPLVMGGNCQETWEHGVPKAKHAGPRIAVMFRETLPLGVMRKMPSPGYQAVTNF